METFTKQICKPKQNYFDHEFLIRLLFWYFFKCNYGIVSMGEGGKTNMGLTVLRAEFQARQFAQPPFKYFNISMTLDLVCHHKKKTKFLGGN